MQQPFPAYRGDGPYLFVCYAHKDVDAVYREIIWLNEYGVNLWYDEGISPGDEWRDELASAIQGCTKVLFFVTPNSVVSENCRRELSFAQEEQREVIAIHLEPTEVPAGLRLGLNNRQGIHKGEFSSEEYRKRLIRVAHDGGGPMLNTPDRPVSPRSTRWLSIAAPMLAVLGLITLGAVFWPKAPQNISPDGTATESVTDPNPDVQSEVLHNSIAVLPFANLSPDPNDAYFSAGVHEEVLNQLVKIQDLSVIARTTMLRYADSDLSVPEIGAELNVGSVMEGSVRYAGDRVRITAQLIDSHSGAQLWSEAYEEDLEDIFGIQLAIATKIANTLEAEFSTSEKQRVSAQITTSPEAYAHYLRAVARWGNYEATGPMHEAVDAAIALDPQFAEALAFKAFLHAIEAIAGVAFVGPDFGAEDQWHFASLAAEYASRALGMNAELARAHWAMAWVHLLNREWESSFKSFDRAYEINPNDYIVLNGAAWVSLYRGDIDAGIAFMERSVSVNPGDFANQGNLVGFLVKSERWQEAKQQAEVMVTLEPEALAPYVALARVAANLGDSDATHANALLAQARSDLPSSSLANSYRQIGDKVNARQIADAYFASGREEIDSGQPLVSNPLSNFWMSMAIESYDAALDQLELAIDEGYPYVAGTDLHFLSHHSMFEPIREHPRFVELVRRTGTPVNR